MAGGDRAGDERDRILRLAQGCDPTLLSLSAMEGYLLSRIDGHTPWRLLREIGVMDPDEVDLVLEGWLACETVEVVGFATPARSDRVAARAADIASEQVPKDGEETEIDHTLDLEPELQQRIAAFEQQLDRPYHQILDVAEGATPKEVKKAYFKLSKEFHPDRYFRRDIGPYKDKLSRIFKRVLEAYEMLSDPELRAGVEKDRAHTGVGSAAGGGEPTKLERLRQRMPFKMQSSVNEDRQQQAKTLFDSAITSERMGRFGEALSNVRIAISFDPYNGAYKAKLGELQSVHAEQRVADALGDMSGLKDMTIPQLEEVAGLLEEVLLYRPHDPEINRKAADVAIELDRFDDALDFVTAALAQDPDAASNHTTLGLIHRARGETGHAKKEFDRALELDPNDARAKKAVASIRLGRRSA